MKKLILALMLVCLPVSFVVVETGCTTTYKAATISDVSVHTLMSLYGAYMSVHPEFPMATRAKVKLAWEKWQAAELALIDASKAWQIAAASNDPNATVLKNLVTNATAAYKAADDDLRQLIQGLNIVNL